MPGTDARRRPSEDVRPTLERKLGLKPGSRTDLRALPEEVRELLGNRLAECEQTPAPGDPLDFAMLFVEGSHELVREFDRVGERLAPSGTVWAAWPKKSSGRATDLDDRRVREIGLAAGLVDVKVCSISAVWSGLKFVRRVEDRSPLGVSHGEKRARKRQ